MIETVERRVFGAIEFIDDLTEARVLAPLRIAAPGLRLLRNQRGLYVIREVAGHDDYTRAFDDPPADPPRSNFTLGVEDPAQRYLPRSFSLPLPRLLRAPTLPVVDADNALVPVQVRLSLAAAAPLSPSWAVLRLQVGVDGSDPVQPLANVLVEAAPQIAGLPLQRTLTDRHGEALVVVSAAPPILPDPGPAGLTREFTVALSLVLDRQVVRTGESAAIPLADPGQIAQRRSENHADVSVVAAPDQLLSAGTSRRRALKVTWP